VGSWLVQIDDGRAVGEGDEDCDPSDEEYPEDDLGLSSTLGGYPVEAEREPAKPLEPEPAEPEPEPEPEPELEPNPEPNPEDV
jgi:hypothetical protein